MYDRLDNFMKTETVVGEPIEVGDVKIIPIISASFGLGGGFGEESKETTSGGGGGGVGGKITPDAMLVIKDGNVEMIPVKSKATLEKLIENAEIAHEKEVAITALLVEIQLHVGFPGMEDR